VGDIGLLFAISYSWNMFNISAFSQYEKILGFLDKPLGSPVMQLGTDFILSYALTLICGGYLLASIAKSAQIGLHTWLPDAMEGPTPVSALIHAATMVTAGILLLFRISVLLTTLPYVLLVILILGSSTAVMSGFIASYQTDLKKIIAYSTCSQLGYMFFSCGLTVYSASLFHLLSHGFFKALLFLVAGVIIHLHLNEQNLTKLALFENLKLTNLVTLSLYVGFVALTALPFFSGFYSKEPLLQTGGLFFNLNV
jgi:NADH-quinone oxidoreductase subunit L